jgi:hypothetical protein
MKAEFLRPKFDGSRFAEHTLPLEVARDLAAYETLVVELAKHLYRIENPSRQRLPKGFGNEFHLHLESVQEGSTIPVLAIVAATSLPLFSGDGANPYFEHARDLVAECVAAEPDKLPEQFPRVLLSYFNQIGRSLREDESLTLSRAAVLTPERRKQLVLGTSTVYERQVELMGTISVVNYENNTFRLRLIDNNHATIPMTEAILDDARKYGGRTRFLAIVKAIANYNSHENLQKVIFVQSLDIQPNFQLAAKFEALNAIEDGWFEGQGLGLDKGNLSFVSERFLEAYPEKIALPFITPTPEGNLLFEWNIKGSPSVDLDLSSMTAEFHAFLPDGADLEQDFSLLSDENWAAFFAFLSLNVEPNAE